MNSIIQNPNIFEDIRDYIWPEEISKIAKEEK
jgi:hypothetical protein